VNPAAGMTVNAHNAIAPSKRRMTTATVVIKALIMTLAKHTPAQKLHALTPPCPVMAAMITGV